MRKSDKKARKQARRAAKRERNVERRASKEARKAAKRDRNAVDADMEDYTDSGLLFEGDRAVEVVPAPPPFDLASGFGLIQFAPSPLPGPAPAPGFAIPPSFYAPPPYDYPGYGDPPLGGGYGSPLAA